MIEEPGRTATVPRERQEERTRSRALDPYKVILHNDDVNSMDHVVRSLVRSVPGMSIQKAARIMLEAHNSGRAVVTVCPLELAELKESLEIHVQIYAAENGWIQLFPTAIVEADIVDDDGTGNVGFEAVVNAAPESHRELDRDAEARGQRERPADARERDRGVTPQRAVEREIAQMRRDRRGAREEGRAQ